MIQTFTPNHFLLAAYGELPAGLAREMQEDLEHCEPDAQEFQNIIDILEHLESLRLKPSQTSIEIILQHSRKNSPLRVEN